MTIWVFRLFENMIFQGVSKNCAFLLIPWLKQSFLNLSTPFKRTLSGDFDLQFFIIWTPYSYAEVFLDIVSISRRYLLKTSQCHWNRGVKMLSNYSKCFFFNSQLKQTVSRNLFNYYFLLDPSWNTLCISLTVNDRCHFSLWSVWNFFEWFLEFFKK